MQVLPDQLTATAAELCLGPLTLHGHLTVPAHALGLVLFAHGSGSSSQSRRNRQVAAFFHEIGLATLLFDLLSPAEKPPGGFDARLRFDVNLLAGRLRAATDWAGQQVELGELRIGYFGAGTGAAAALVTAAAEGPRISAVVTRGGRTEMAGDAPRQVRAPTLLIVGANDHPTKAANLETWAQLRGPKSIEIIPGTDHTFEEPGALDNVAALAARWFAAHFGRDAVAR